MHKDGCETGNLEGGIEEMATGVCSQSEKALQIGGNVGKRVDEILGDLLKNGAVGIFPSFTDEEVSEQVDFKDWLNLRLREALVFANTTQKVVYDSWLGPKLLPQIAFNTDSGVDESNFPLMEDLRVGLHPDTSPQIEEFFKYPNRALFFWEILKLLSVDAAVGVLFSDTVRELINLFWLSTNVVNANLKGKVSTGTEFRDELHKGLEKLEVRLQHFQQFNDWLCSQLRQYLENELSPSRRENCSPHTQSEVSKLTALRQEIFTEKFEAFGAGIAGIVFSEPIDNLLDTHPEEDKDHRAIVKSRLQNKIDERGTRLFFANSPELLNVSLFDVLGRFLTVAESVLSTIKANPEMEPAKASELLRLFDLPFLIAYVPEFTGMISADLCEDLSALPTENLRLWQSVTALTQSFAINKRQTAQAIYSREYVEAFGKITDVDLVGDFLPEYGQHGNPKDMSKTEFFTHQSNIEFLGGLKENLMPFLELLEQPTYREVLCDSKQRLKDRNLIKVLSIAPTLVLLLERAENQKQIDELFTFFDHQFFQDKRILKCMRTLPI